MKKIEIKGNLPKFTKIFSGLNIIVLGAVFLILLIVTVSFGGTVYDSYAQAQINEQKTAEMEKYIADWMEKSEIVNNSKMHPVKPEELDKVQTVLLTSLKQYGLNITGFKSEKAPAAAKPVTETVDNNGQPTGQNQQQQAKKNTNAHDYELNVEGNYSGVVNFLNSIHQNNILISIKSLKLQQQKGLIKADLKYRVYTK